MKAALVSKLILAALALAAASTTAFTQTRLQQGLDAGKRHFQANCASCHGVDGKGSGAITDLLQRSPPDLTLLARSNKGVFPFSRLYEVIDGGNVPAHGSREMPAWGRDYRVQDAEYYGEVPYDPEALVRARILSLLEYINRIQAG